MSERIFDLEADRLLHELEARLDLMTRLLAESRELAGACRRRLVVVAGRPEIRPEVAAAIEAEAKLQRDLSKQAEEE